jgi:uncharacterized membrane protein YtjA (UPF0391 family)
MSYAQGSRSPTVIKILIPDTSATRRLLLKVLQGAHMLHYAVVFFVIALIAAFFGFGGIAVGAAGIAKILFIVFLIGAVVTFLMSLGRRV